MVGSLLVLALGQACAFAKPAVDPVPAKALSPVTAQTTSSKTSKDLWNLALIVSGYEDRHQRNRVRATFKTKVDAMGLNFSGEMNPAAKAQTILAKLHGSKGLFKKYNARATTLKELVEKGEFNCLSASVVFALLAQEAGLDVVGELLPSHARILLRDKGRVYRIETTSPEGFAPSPEALKRILAQSVGAENFRSRSLVDSRGAQTETRLLIALIYVNRASIAQEKGELRTAEELFRKGENLATQSPMRKILREQRAALLSQLGANDMMSSLASRQQRAFSTMLRSARLKPEQALIREAVHQNLRAAAERVIATWAMQRRPDQEILGVVDQATDAGLADADGAALRAFAYSEIARKRAKASNYDGALSAMDKAMSERLAPRDTKLRTSLLQNHVAALRLAAMTSAKLGAYAKSMLIIERLLSLHGISAKQRQEYESDRKQAMLLSAGSLIEKEQFADAAMIYRAGRRLYPQDATIKHNLIAALERMGLGMVNQGLCEDVAAILKEIRALDPKESFTEPAAIRCLLIRTNNSLLKDDYPEAIAWLKAAKREFPRNTLIQDNLIVAYLKWMQFEAGRKACGKTSSIASKLLEISSAPRKQIQEIQATCASP